MLNKKQIGNLTELKCISAFYELGYSINIPYGENNRYDFIADIGGKLIKVQVKTSSTKDGNSYKFSCRSSRTNRKRTINKKYTKSEIDYFCTIIDEKCCLIPVEECSNDKTIRINESLNNQQKNVNYIDDYLLINQINKILI